MFRVARKRVALRFRFTFLVMNGTSWCVKKKLRASLGVSRKSQEKDAPRPSTRVSRKNALDVSRRAFHGVKQVERALSGKRAVKASNDRVQTRDDDVAVGCARAASLRGVILPPRNPDDDSRMRTTTGCGQT